MLVKHDPAGVLEPGGGVASKLVGDLLQPVPVDQLRRGRRVAAGRGRGHRLLAGPAIVDIVTSGCRGLTSTHFRFRAPQARPRDRPDRRLRIAPQRHEGSRVVAALANLARVAILILLPEIGLCIMKSHWLANVKPEVRNQVSNLVEVVEAVAVGLRSRWDS